MIARGSDQADRKRIAMAIIDAMARESLQKPEEVE